MSMLARYKKPGGFLSLLKLIEACDSIKQKKFITMVESEDLRWARAIKERMITFDRILSWNDETLSCLALQAPVKIMGTVCYKVGPELSERFIGRMPSKHKKMILESYEFGEPSNGEIVAAFIRFIEITRDLISDSFLVASSFDLAVSVEGELEEILSRPPMEAKVISGEASVDSVEQDLSSTGQRVPVFTGKEEMLELKVEKLEAENGKLKLENKKLRHLIKRAA